MKLSEIIKDMEHYSRDAKLRAEKYDSPYHEGREKAMLDFLPKLKSINESIAASNEGSAIPKDNDMSKEDEVWDELSNKLRNFCDDNDYIGKPVQIIMPMIFEEIKKSFILTPKTNSI